MVLKERTDPQIAEWRMLEACLGYDPDEAPSDFLEHLHDQNDLYGTGAVQELAAASKNNAITHLQTLGDEIKKRGITVQVSQYNEIQKRLAAQRDQSNNPTWQRGAQAAKVARSVWNLPDGPISNHTLSGIFGFDMSESYPGELDSKPTLPLSGGMRDDSSEGEFRVSFNQRHLTGPALHAGTFGSRPSRNTTKRDPATRDSRQDQQAEVSTCFRSRIPMPS